MKQVIEAHAGARKLLGLREQERMGALQALAEALEQNSARILLENAKDVALASGAGLSRAMLDRLTLTEKSIAQMACSCREIAAFPQVVGQIVSETKRSDGLVIQKQRIPLGVIAMIFESRPNVVIDAAALAIKSGNAIVLKGGKEALHSNRVLTSVVHESIARFVPVQSIQLIESREDVKELLRLNQYIDLVVPRGGEQLIRFVKEHATMPVVAHDRGLCHVYLHADADPAQARTIVLNAKAQRPGVCNALETLLVHRDFPRAELAVLLQELQVKSVEIHACAKTHSLIPGLVRAQDTDFDTEWLDLKLSLKEVASELEAIEHIQRHGTHHTEAVLTQTPEVAEVFLNSIDASCLAINASTRFNDGGELGLGAELGISTSKLHAYGAMGAQEMTTTRFIVRGNGHVRN